MKRLIFWKRFIMAVTILVTIFLSHPVLSMEKLTPAERKKFGWLSTAKQMGIQLPDDSQRIIALQMIDDFLDESKSTTFRGHVAYVSSITFSPDGNFFATGSADGTAKIWDLKTRQPKQNFVEGDGFIRCIAFSPDGELFATASYDTKIWNLKTGRSEYKLAGRAKHRNYSVAFSPGGERLAIGSSDKTVKVWNLDAGELEYNLVDHTDVVTCVAFSPDGERLATGSYDKTVNVWDLSTGKIKNILVGHTNRVNSVVFSPDGNYIVTGSDDKTAKIWSAKIGKCLHTLTGHTSAIWSVAVSPDSTRVITGSLDKTAKIWDLKTGQVKHTFVHAGTVTSVTFSPDGHYFATGSGDNSAKIWNLTPTEAQKWIYAEILPMQANLISRAFIAKKAHQQFIIRAGSDDAQIWVSFPDYVRAYLNMHLDIIVAR